MIQVSQNIQSLLSTICGLISDFCLAKCHVLVFTIRLVSSQEESEYSLQDLGLSYMEEEEVSREKRKEKGKEQGTSS